MTDSGLTRRDALLCAAALAFQGSLLSSCWSGDPRTTKVVKVFRGPKNAAAIGEAWLAQQNPRPNLKELIDRIFESAELPDDLKSMLLLLGSRHRDDFSNGRTTQVQGWVLSLTEVHLYAVVALR